MKNFVKLMEVVRDYPYAKTFKVSEIFPGFNELTEKEKNNLLRQFVAFSMDNYEFRIEDEDKDDLSDFDYTYSKSLRDNIDMGSFNEALENALFIRTLEPGREFILPELIREQEKSMMDRSVRDDSDTEIALNELINKGSIPFIKIIGKTFGFTIYKKL